MQKVTITDVARKSGYGVGTVSRVISGDKSVKDSTRDKINKVIADLHYVPNVTMKHFAYSHHDIETNRLIPVELGHSVAADLCCRSQLFF